MGRSALGLLGAACRAWHVFVAAGRALRGRSEVLRAQRGVRLRQQALVRWRARTRRLKVRDDAGRVWHVALSGALTRWRRRCLQQQVWRDRMQAVNAWTCRSRTLWGLSRWRESTMQSRRSADRNVAVWARTRRAKLLRGLGRWWAITRESRRLVVNGHTLQIRTSRSLLALYNLAWRAHVQRRLNDVALVAVTRQRQASSALRRILSMWHVVLLCFERQQLRELRSAQNVLGAWRAATVAIQTQLAAQAAERIASLRRSVAAWSEACVSTAQAHQRATAAQRTYEAAIMRTLMHSWREHQLRRTHLRRLLPEVDAAACRSLARYVFGPWRKRTLRRLQVLKSGVAHQTRMAETMVARRLRAWHCAAIAAQRGAVLAQYCADREAARHLAAWRRIAAVARLPRLRARLEERFLHDGVAFAMSHLVSQHRNFQAAVSDFAAVHPELLQRLQAMLADGREDRRNALTTWHSLAHCRRQRSQLQASLRTKREARTRRLTLGAWDAFRASASAKKAHEALAAQLRRLLDYAGVCREAWLHWRAATATARRDRQGAELALAADRRRVLRCTWSSWSWLAVVATTAALTASRAEEAWSTRAMRGVFSGWYQRCRWEAAARIATMRFLSVQIRRRVSASFACWRTAARALAALETRQRLQADDLRRRRRSMLCWTVAGAWREEATRARQEAYRARATKVLRCWHLYAQEQALLQRYLNQCATANFRGFRGIASGEIGGDVEPADFERLYEQMAELRWD